MLVQQTAGNPEHCWNVIGTLAPVQMVQQTDRVQMGMPTHQWVPVEESPVQRLAMRPLALWSGVHQRQLLGWVPVRQEQRNGATATDMDTAGRREARAQVARLHTS
jgi:hypothetical protein